MSIGTVEAVPGRMLSAEQAQSALQRLNVSARRAGAMQQVLERLRYLARGNEPAWLRGELGSGRLTAALALHALSSRREGPLLLVHGSELGSLLRLLHTDRVEAQQRLWQLDAVARGGSLLLDEGGAPDPAMETLLLEMIALRTQARLVLLSPSRAPDGPLGRELLGCLGQRLADLPPLRQRRAEILLLGHDLLREEIAPADAELVGLAGRAGLADEPSVADSEEERTIVADAPVGEDAGALLERHDWPGNLWQLRHCLARLSRAGVTGPITADELSPYLPAQSPDTEERVQVLDETAQALADLLRPLVPVLPAPGPSDPDSAQDLPWAPLLLYRSGDEPPARYRLGLGPAPMDEGRLVAGLQARPLGPAGGARTGDAPALGRLGPMWRGNLLALLRVVQRELMDPRSPYLDLLGLGQLLRLAGPPLPTEKLVRLLLYLPVELQDDETEALLARVPGAAGPAAACRAPALGLLWADAVRGLLPRDEQEQFHAHAVECERCAQALQAFWQLEEVLRFCDAELPASETRSDSALLATLAEPPPPEAFMPSLGAVQEAEGPSTSDKTEVRISTAHVPRALSPEAPEGPQPPADPVTRPVPLPEAMAAAASPKVVLEATLPGIAPRPGPLSPAAPPPQSSLSPLPAPGLLSLMRVQHWLMLALLLLLMLVLGTLIGLTLTRR